MAVVVTDANDNNLRQQDTKMALLILLLSSNLISYFYVSEVFFLVFIYKWKNSSILGFETEKFWYM